MKKQQLTERIEKFFKPKDNKQKALLFIDEMIEAELEKALDTHSRGKNGCK